MKTHSLLKHYFNLFLFFLLAGSTSSQAQVLLAGTEFNPLPGKESQSYFGIEDVQWYGPAKGSVSVTPPLFANASSYYYHAVTDNPSKLNGIKYSNLASPDYQIIFSSPRTVYNMLEYTFVGLAPGMPVKATVSYCSPIRATGSGCVSSDSITSFRGVINPDQYNALYGIMAPIVELGKCSTVTITQSTSNSSVVGKDGKVTLRLNADWVRQCTDIAITKIEITGFLKPILVTPIAVGSTVCTGDFISVETDDFQGSAYQWQIFENQVWADIPSATNKSLYYKTSTVKPLAFRVGVTVPGGTLFYSDSLVFDVADCCGGPTMGSTLQTIFKDDFGRVDLSDKTGKTYKVWDYLTDPSNPKEVTKTTTTPFRWPISPAPLGATFVGVGPPQDGQYTVAGVITSYNSYDGFPGALMQWASNVKGLSFPRPVSYDHSEKLEGAALFINCPPNTKDEVLYSRTINSLCTSGKLLLFECWIAVFTPDANGSYNGVDVNVKLTDVDNPANTVLVNGKATREADGGGKWVKIAGQITLTGNSVRMDIINNQNVSVNGNDLVIDDIKIMTCSTPQPESFFNATTFSKTDTLCDEPFQLELLESENLNNYYNKQPYYLHQYSKTPNDLASWKNLGTPSSQSKAEVVGSTLLGLSNGDKVYFRTVVAASATFTAKNNFQGVGNYANGNDACKNYSVSTPIAALWTNSVKCSFSTDLRSYQETESFHAYPNPMKDLLVVGEETTSAQLYNAMGQLVLQGTTSQLHVGHLQAGLYQVTVQLKNGKTVTQKVMKE